MKVIFIESETKEILRTSGHQYIPNKGEYVYIKGIEYIVDFIYTDYDINGVEIKIFVKN